MLDREKMTRELIEIEEKGKSHAEMQGVRQRLRGMSLTDLAAEYRAKAKKDPYTGDAVPEPAAINAN